MPLSCGGLQKQLVHRALVLLIGHVQRAALAVKAVLELLVVFRAFEQRQHLVIRPAGVAQRSPVVVVPPVAAHVQHGVDGAGAAQRLAARLVAPATVEAGLGHGLVGVVVDLRRHHGHHAGRRVDQHALVGPAGLQQADGHVRVFAQAGGQHTAGRAGADDDVVKGLGVHVLSPVGKRLLRGALPDDPIPGTICPMHSKH